jgi:hypothetical protein
MHRDVHRMFSTSQSKNGIVRLHDTALSAGELKSLLPTLEALPNRQMLNCRGSTLDDKALEAIKSLNPNFRMLDLMSSNLAGTKALVELMGSSSPLSHLNLSLNKGLKNEHIQSLAKALESNTSLTSMSLWYIGMSDIGTDALLKALLVNKTLRTLDLRDNPDISSEKLSALNEALNKNKQRQTEYVKAFLKTMTACMQGIPTVLIDLATSYLTLADIKPTPLTPSPFFSTKTPEAFTERLTASTDTPSLSPAYH